MTDRFANLEKKLTAAQARIKTLEKSIAQQELEIKEKFRQSQESMELALIGGDLAWWDWNLVTDEIKYERSDEVLGFNANQLDDYYNNQRIFPDDIKESRKIDNEIKSGILRFYDYEYRVLTNTGEIKWIADKGKVIETDASGRSLRMVGTSQDITVRKKTEEVIKENRERMDLALKGAKLGMWDWNIAADTFVLDQRIQEILGYSPNNTIEWYKYVLPDDLKNFKAVINNTLNGLTNIIDHEYRTIVDQGKIRWVHDWGQVVDWDKKGKPVRAIGTTQDITQHKENEKIIKESRRGMELALKGADLGTWDWNIVSDRFILDEKTIEIIGHNPINTGDWNNHIHPDDLKIVKANDNAVIKGLTDVIDYEYRSLADSGEMRWIRSWGRVAEWDKQGKAIRAMGTTQDINLQKKTEQSLKESQERMELALKGSESGMWDYNIPLDIWLFDERSVELIGSYPKTEKAFNLLIHPDDFQSYQDTWNDVEMGNVSVYISEYRLKDSSGKYKWLMGKGKIVEWDSDNNPIRATGIIHDITKRKETEKLVNERTIQLERSNQELEVARQKLKKAHDELEQRVEERTKELNRINIEFKKSQDELIRSERLVALGNMVAGVAHEINTPVGICVTESTFLEDQTNELLDLIETEQLTHSQFQAYIKNAKAVSNSIYRNLSRVGNLIKSFKLVAIDQTTDERRRFNLKQYLEEVLLSLRSKIKQKQHTITIICSNDVVIDSYPGAFAQIITNFVINSLLHGFDNDVQGWVQIEISIGEDTLTVIYKDNGKGMDSDTLKQVFDPFFTTNRANGGSGLGMHVVYNIVTQKLKGKILCCSSPGQGVEFKIDIPL
jgi:PAS domain S-box-containing protein